MFSCTTSKMRQRKFNLIVAACENLGIGIKGNLPWHLKSELKYFNRTTTKVADESKRNCVIMGRRTYFGIPESKRPLPNRLNIVLSRTSSSSDYPDGVLVFKSLDEAMEHLNGKEFDNDIEHIWICGGNSVYKEAMASSLSHRIYFTEIMAYFECDAFFPEIPRDIFHIVPNDDDIPSDIQEENGIKYQYKIYER